MQSVKEWKIQKNTKIQSAFLEVMEKTKYKITKCIFGSYENTKTNAKRQSVFFVFILYLYILYFLDVFKYYKKYETK